MRMLTSHFQKRPAVVIGVTFGCIALVAGLTAWQGSIAKSSGLQGMQATFSRRSDGEREWVELAIAVDGSASFKMPVFIEQRPGHPPPSEAEVADLIDEWLKSRAREIASRATVVPSENETAAFLKIAAGDDK